MVQQAYVQGSLADLLGCRENCMAFLGMAEDDGEFGVVEFSGFVEDHIRDAHLAHIMQHSRQRPVHEPWLHPAPFCGPD
jgi:hypothetical protein